MNKNEMLISLSESKKCDFGKKDFLKQSKEQKVFSTIWSLESEVNNGGFTQYFSNGSAETVHFLIEALKTIGAEKLAQICSDAIKVAFPKGLPSDPQKFSNEASEFPDGVLENLESIDSKFYEYPDNLTELLFDFVSKNSKDLGEIEKTS